MSARQETPVTLFWLRRDLRLDDNTALQHALTSGFPVLPVFIFDTQILDELADPKDARVTFIYQEVIALKDILEKKYDSSLHILHDSPQGAFLSLLKAYEIREVHANEDYEPYARQRDKEVNKILSAHGVAFHAYKDQVIFGKDEILKSDGTPYTVFTPYSKQWLAHAGDADFQSKGNPGKSAQFLQCKALPVPTLKKMGFEEATDAAYPSRSVSAALLKSYGKTRNFPAANKTSHLGLHLRFGTISIRQLAAQAREQSDVFLNELIWREFFMQILWHFPKVTTESFKAKYDAIPWENDQKMFEKWCAGMTGYPMVDAGMRELNETGFMHNRVRMVVASFLTKHLLIDWRWGEAYFAEKLLDYELASNNGNWQWAAGCGCDAAPYFRIFNPMEQARKFDPENQYIRKWIPEFGTEKYPEPIVEHKEARERALATYADAVKEA